MKTIFPKEILEYTSELHRHKFLKKSQTIYTILLISFTCLVLATPFIKVDLYSSSFGMIRPSKERNLITSPVNGKIDKVLIFENASVKKGDTLITIDDSIVSSEITQQQEDLDSLKLLIHDLKKLCYSQKVQSDSLITPLLKSDFTQYQQKLKNLERKLHKKLIHYKRQKYLFANGVIAKIEFEASSFELEKSRNELNYLKQHQKNVWLHDLYQKKSEENLSQSRLLELDKNRSLHYIIAPSTGSIQALKGLERNNFLYSGKPIAEISPQTDLMVECYISPSDIGLLKNKHPVKFQVDAFNHNRWGSATGHIVSINNDISTINDHPMFKVLCSINEKKLFLNKTTRGTLQKGMTLKALFLIDKRSLFQLLFDELEDWYDLS